MTTGERLVQLSPLTSATAEEHLLAIQIGSGSSVLAEITGSLINRDITSAFLSSETIDGNASKSTISGDVDDVQVMKGNIIKKTIR